MVIIFWRIFFVNIDERARRHYSKIEILSCPRRVPKAMR